MVWRFFLFLSRSFERDRNSQKINLAHAWSKAKTFTRHNFQFCFTLNLASFWLTPIKGPLGQFCSCLVTVIYLYLKASPENTRLGWKCLAVTNTLGLITSVKSLRVLCPRIKIVRFEFDILTSLKWRRDTEHNDTEHNATQHNDTEYNDTQHNDTQHNNTQHDDTQQHDT